MTGVASLLSSFLLNAVFSPAGNPGVERPVVPADVFVYTFEALGYLLIAIGVTALVVALPQAREQLSAYLAVAFLWIAAVFFTLVTHGRRAQVEAFEAGRSDLLIDGALPGWDEFYSVGYVFFGAGIGFTAVILVRTELTHRIGAMVGGIIGVALAIFFYSRLVMGSAAVDYRLFFPGFIALLVWLVATGVMVYRDARRM